MSNASLKFYLPSGPVTVKLYIQTFSVSVRQDLSTASLKFGESIEPIRVTGETVDFQVVYSVQNYEKMEKLCDLILFHSLNALNSQTPPLMTFSYHSINRTWQGLISAIEKGDKRWQTSYRRNFRLDVMRNLQPTPTIAGDIPAFGRGGLMFSKDWT